MRSVFVALVFLCVVSVARSKRYGGYGGGGHQRQRQMFGHSRSMVSFPSQQHNQFGQTLLQQPMQQPQFHVSSRFQNPIQFTHTQPYQSGFLSMDHALGAQSTQGSLAGTQGMILQPFAQHITPIQSPGVVYSQNVGFGQTLLQSTSGITSGAGGIPVGTQGSVGMPLGIQTGGFPAGGQSTLFQTGGFPARTSGVSFQTGGFPAGGQSTLFQTGGLPARTSGVSFQTGGFSMGTQGSGLQTGGIPLGIQGASVEIGGLPVGGQSTLFQTGGFPAGTPGTSFQTGGFSAGTPGTSVQTGGFFAGTPGTSVQTGRFSSGIPGASFQTGGFPAGTPGTSFQTGGFPAGTPSASFQNGGFPVGSVSTQIGDGFSNLQNSPLGGVTTIGVQPNIAVQGSATGVHNDLGFQDLALNLPVTSNAGFDSVPQAFVDTRTGVPVIGDRVTVPKFGGWASPSVDNIAVREDRELDVFKEPTLASLLRKLHMR